MTWIISLKKILECGKEANKLKVSFSEDKHIPYHYCLVLLKIILDLVHRAEAYGA